MMTEKTLMDTLRKSGCYDPPAHVAELMRAGWVTRVGGSPPWMGCGWASK